MDEWREKENNIPTEREWKKLWSEPGHRSTEAMTQTQVELYDLLAPELLTVIFTCCRLQHIRALHIATKSALFLSQVATYMGRCTMQLLSQIATNSPLYLSQG